jgi:hypothetical protein
MKTLYFSTLPKALRFSKKALKLKAGFTGISYVSQKRQAGPEDTPLPVKLLVFYTDLFIFNKFFNQVF